MIRQLIMAAVRPVPSEGVLKFSEQGQAAIGKWALKHTMLKLWLQKINLAMKLEGLKDIKSTSQASVKLEEMLKYL